MTLLLPMPARLAVEAWQRAAAPLAPPHIAAVQAAAAAAAPAPTAQALMLVLVPSLLLASCRPVLPASSS
jgi:hypothetical protein